ncbi:hypothetical protein DPMN_122649 [Dreissena polymorpha]|uniref:Uncharacterized protein n=1 Tax=Dreissena polymorpha TaxID=45954 RepID=A0A9D4GPT3_DREPO|nr:hypothetical protein DPMN_122649 [Dreissena polymorpha]
MWPLEKNAPPLGSHVFQENVTILDRKIPRPLDGHVFQTTGTISKLIHDIIGTNLLNRFYEDRTINVASRVLTNIIGTNLLTKFHEDRKINVASRVFTRKNVPPPGSHVFQPTGIIF